MADKMREILLSERGREIVNVVFFLSFLLRNRGIVFAAYVVWGILSVVLRQICFLQGIQDYLQGCYGVRGGDGRG